MRLLLFRSVVAFCLLSFGWSATCDAQYRERREKYSHIEYTYHSGDPLPPFVAAFGSVLLPGLGQVIAGEPLRGLGFATGVYGSAALSFIGLVNVLDEDFDNRKTATSRSMYKTLFVGGLVSSLIFYGYGIFDAMEVAEINNLAYRDRQKGLSWQLAPDLNSLTAQPQLSFRLKYSLGN